MTEKCGEVVIRDAVLTDAERIREIYDHYVRHTAISFEYETPTPEEMRERMHRTMARFPYLAAERDGVVQGYAYAGPFKERAAYDWCCELSIYLAQDARKCGMGRRLYAAMEERLRDMGVLNLYACITCPDREDEYVTRNSMEFHSHLGFRQVAEFRSCGLLLWQPNPHFCLLVQKQARVGRCRQRGCAHTAFSLESREAVDALTQ